jgi:hypothetical protein
MKVLGGETQQEICRGAAGGENMLETQDGGAKKNTSGVNLN